MSQSGVRKYRYPRYDLESALEVADKIREAGGAVSNDQLAGLLNYKSPINGAYMARVSAARMFGLIEGQAEKITLTTRARDILEPLNPTSQKTAKAEAFLTVPLFAAFFQQHEGRPLQDRDLLESELVTRFDVPPRRAKMALARLRQSAAQAGFFQVSDNKMVRPLGTLGGGSPEPASEPKSPSQSLDLLPAHSKLIEGALDLLPSQNGWSEQGLRDWLALMELALRVHYRLPREGGTTRKD